jgi:hypothetical protein
MSRVSPRIALAAALVALATSALAAPAFAEDCAPRVVGAGVTLASATPVADILDRPEEFVGRAVLVEGEVADVCQAAGCWLEMRAGDGARTIKVKVEDGVLVFPKDARGKAARAEGVVERLDLDREGYLIHLEHEAHEQGKDFDEAAVPAEGPYHVYRIAGTGAEVCS